jgi:hypothetical protein
MRVVTRAPFVPRGALTTCTRISLPDFEQLADIALAQFGAFRGGRWFVGVHRFGQDVTHIQKGVALQPDVDERGVHARQHILHHAFVDIADDALAPLEAQFHQLPVLQNGDSRLAGRDIHQDFADNLIVRDSTPPAGLFFY